MPNIVWVAGFVVLWSSGFVGATLAGDSSVAGVLAWRYLVTALLLAPLSLLSFAARSRRPGVSLKEIGQQAVIGVLAHVVFLGGVFGAAAAGVDAGTTALVCALQPMLVAVASRVWWGDRVSRRVVVGLVIGVIAVALTVGGASTWGPAVALPVASVLGLSLAALLERRWQPRTDLMLGLAVQVAVGAMAFTAFAAATGTLAISVTPQFVGAVAWLVVLSGIGGYTTFLVCLRRMGASATSALLYLTPPVTTLWVWLMFDEPPQVSQLLGLALGAAAVGLALGNGYQHRASSDRQDTVDSKDAASQTSPTG